MNAGQMLCSQQIDAPATVDEAPAPLRESFPRHHRHCDRCGCAVSYATKFRAGSVETAACEFHYVLCIACGAAMDELDDAERQEAMRPVLVRHAAHYSAEFAEFVARWYGLPASPVTVPASRAG
jgi:hypothetical protein